MSESQMKKAIEKYKNSSICASCPTYNECAGKANEKMNQEQSSEFF
jgi:hypothetical protein